MLGVGRGSAVSAEEQAAPCPQHPDDVLSVLFDLGFELKRHGLGQRAELVERAADNLGQA